MSDAPRETKEVREASAIEKFFFLRPTFGLLLAVLMTAGGVMAYFALVKESLPDLDIPQATIVTVWPGADPQTIEQEVTEKIEKEIKTLRNVKSVNSASFDSSSIIAVEFQADADSGEAASLLREKVSNAESELPRDAEKPEINQLSVDDRPIITFVLSGEVSDAVLSDLAQRLQDQLERLPGVNEVGLGGARDEVIQILLDPRKLLSLGISPTTVRDAIQAANLDVPWGEIDSDEIGATVRFTGRFRELEDLRSLPIARLGEGIGRPVRLSEVGTVRRDLEEEVSRATLSWKGAEFAPSVEVSVKKAPGSDSIAVAARARAAVQEARDGRGWPSGVNFRVSQDESEQIWDALGGVLDNAWQAMLAVFVILFLLLTWREGIIAGLSIPLTFLGALIVIWAMGNTLNELVIIGMVLALGLLVDVFILMMEGLHEGIFVEKLTFGQAALKTVKRYAVPAFAGQLTTILALAPLMAIGGLPGKFIRVLPIAAIACLVVSFIVAMLVAIPLSRLLLGRVGQNGVEERKTRADRITESASRWLKQWSLSKTLRSRRVAALWIGGAVVLFVLSIVALTRVPLVMYPKGDGLKLGITIELPPSTTLDSSQLVADRIGEVLREKPYLESIVKLVGEKSPLSQQSITDSLRPTAAENYVGFSCIFLPLDERDEPAYVYADELREELGDILRAGTPGASLLIVADTGEPAGGDPIQITLSGDDLGTLRQLSAEVQAALSQISGTSDVRDNLGALRPEIILVPKREALDFYGISQSDLGAQVRYAMGTAEIGDYALPGVEEDLPIKLGLLWPSRQGRSGGPTRIAEMSLVRAFTPDGTTVPLTELLDPVSGESPVSITHTDARRAITVLGKSPGRPVTEVMAELQPRLDEMQGNWPSGYRYSVGGEAQETAETFGSAGVMLVVAVIMVFGVLVLVFGSFMQAFIVITALPFALIGTFLGFYLTGMSLSFFAMVGIIALIGIVANDSIVMVDTMNIHLRDGIKVAEAAARGAADRLRPILSTSITTIVGLIPMAISNPMWRPLCFAVIFGLIASTVLSLIIVPCLYLLLTRRSMAEVECLD